MGGVTVPACTSQSDGLAQVHLLLAGHKGVGRFAAALAAPFDEFGELFLGGLEDGVADDSIDQEELFFLLQLLLERGWTKARVNTTREEEMQR